MDRIPPRTLLALLVQQGSHTIEETCRAFNTTARKAKENVELSPRQLTRWMAGKVEQARPASRRVAEAHFGYTFKELLGPASAQRDPRPQAAAAPDVPPPGSVEVSTRMAANESSQHAAGVSGGVDPVSVEQVRESILRLARSYHELPPMRALADARHARDLAYVLLERTKRPDQTSELYLAAGCACALMACASFDLAAWVPAADQARAAHTYAELVGHAGLRAWAAGEQAINAHWTGQPRRALSLVEAGLDGAPAGAATARLRGAEARAWALVGNADAMLTSLRAADDAMAAARGDDELHDGVGGQFGYGPALHSACAGTAFLTVGDGARSAKRIRTALSMVTSQPYGGLMPERAHIDLAGAELVAGNLDAAVATLEEVWAIPAQRRRHSLTGRLQHVAHQLTDRPWRADRAAVDLRDRIEVFTSEASAHRL